MLRLTIVLGLLTSFTWSSPRVATLSSGSQVYLPLVSNSAGSAANSAPTIIDKIDEDQQAGRISPEQAKLYKLQAISGSPELPAAYASAPGGLDGVDGTPIVSDIVANWSSLGGTWQQALTPYLVRPNDDRSIFKQPLPSSQTGLRAQAERPVNATMVAASGNGRILVWGTSVAEPTALAVADQLGVGPQDKVLGPIEQQMGRTWAGDNGTEWMGFDLISGGGSNEDERLDVYVVPYGLPGITFASPGRPSASYVIINRNAPTADVLQTSVWHELFHVIQNRFKAIESDAQANWWREASANWAVYHFAPNLQYIYNTFVDDLFLYPEWSLDKWASSYGPAQRHAYGAFLWPAVFDGKAGRTGSTVASVWAKMETQTAVQAIKSVLGSAYEDDWREFLVSNWNRKAALLDGTSTAGYDFWAPLVNTTKAGRGIADADITRITLDASNTAHQTISTVKPNVEHLAAQYYLLTITPQTRQVLFETDAWTKQTDAVLAAFIRKEGEAWEAINRSNHLSDWKSDDDGWDNNWHYFCRDVKDTNVEQLLLVFGNASPSSALTADVPIEISDTGCRWQGSVTWEQIVYDNTGDGGPVLFNEGEWRQTATVQGTWVTDRNGNPLDVCATYPDELGCAFSDPSYPHLMLYSTTTPTSLSYSATGWGKEEGACHDGDKVTYNGPYKGLYDLVIWGNNYNQFTYYGRLDIASGLSSEPLPGCTPPDTPTTGVLDYFSIGKLIPALYMQPTTPTDGTQCLDGVRMVTPSGNGIQGTWTIDEQGSYDNSPCTAEPGGTGYTLWKYYYSVTINLTRTPEP